MQVCSTWRSITLSELLWQELTRRVWSRHHRSLPTWREEFGHLHRTGRNFRTRRSVHSHIFPHSAPLSCRRLAFSDRHLAGGFLDGSVRLFDLTDGGALLYTYGPHPHQSLGPFSHSIAGLFLLPGPDRLVFASQDGDVHVADIDPLSPAARRVHVGNLVEDGPLVDFAGDGRWWVGLFAGVPGRSWHVWDGVTEQLVYVLGSLTDPESVMGWRVLTDVGGPTVARVRIAEPGIAVGCTGARIHVLGLEDEDVDVDVGNLDLRRGAIVDAVDACDGRVMVVDQRGVARVYVARTLEEVCRFSTVRRGGAVVGTVGCMNWMYAVVCSPGATRVWDVMTGEFLYSFRERVGETTVIAASYRYVAAWAVGTGLHLWDFGAL